MINIEQNTTNTFALTLNEELDLNVDPYYFLFSFVNAMTQDEKLFICTDTSTLTERYNLFQLIEGTPQDFYGPIPTVELEAGSWTYTVYQMDAATPDDFDPANAVKTLEVGKVWVTFVDCPVPEYGTVPVVPQYIVECAEPVEEETIVIDALEMDCDPDRGWVFIMGYTAVAGSGSYTVQARVVGTEEWQSFETIVGPTDGSDTWNYVAQSLGDNPELPVDIEVRIQDAVNTTIFSNVGTTAFEACEFLILNDLTLSCSSLGRVVVDVTYAVGNGSGLYELQGFIGGTWVLLGSWAGDAYGTNSESLTMSAAFNALVGQDIGFRINDSLLLLPSNTITEIPDCELPSITLNSAEFSCADGFGYETVNITADEGSGDYMVQIFFNGSWQQVAQFAGATSGTTEDTNQLVQFFLDNPGTYDIRVYDGIIYSNTLTITSTDCVPAEIILNYITQTGDVSAYFNGIYQIGPGFLLELQQSVDNLVWVPIGNYVGLQTNPQNNSYDGGNIGFVPQDLTYYRIAGLDVDGNVVVSNSIRFTTSSLSLHSAEYSQNPPQQMDYDFTAVNVRERTTALLDLELQYSGDSLPSSFIELVYDNAVLPSSPYTGSTTGSALNGNLSLFQFGQYMRLSGRDANGGPVYSNALRVLPTAPVLTLVVPGCTAGQQTVEVQGTCDPNAAWTFYVEYYDSMMGWQNAGTVIATSPGTIGSQIVNIGIGNTYAGQLLDFRLESVEISLFYSNTYSTTMPTAC